MDVSTYYRLLRRWRWLIAATTLAAVAIAIAIKPLPGKDFEAIAVLSVPSAQRSLFIVSGLPPETGSVRDAAAFSLLRSRDLAERVIKQYGFEIRPDELRRRLTVTKDQGTDLIRISVTGRTPSEAIALTNAVAETAAAYDQESQSRAGTLAREFVEKQVQDARANLQKAEDALLAFKQNKELELSSPRAAQLGSLQAEGQRVTLALSQVEARLASIRGMMGQHSATRTDHEISDNPIAQQLRGELVALEVSLTSELALHTEKYPSVTTLKAKIAAVKERLTAELTRTVSKERTEFNPIYDALLQNRINLETERVALLAEREAIQQALRQARGELPGLDQVQLEQARLNRNVEILAREYADLQNRLAQARLKEQEVQDLGSLAVASPATAARPTAPWGKLARLALAAIFGLTGGAALAFSFEYLDNSVKTPEHAERLLGVPVLAAIPRRDPPFEEAYRLLRINVAAHEPSDKPYVVAVMSPKPREGTSTVVANLARAFARAGRQTIVVDASLQRPTQHVLFGIPNGKGLADLLAEDLPLDDALATTSIPNLRVLRAGSSAPESAALFGHRKMAKLFWQLKQKGDVILVDALPGAFADAFAVASFATGVLLVLDARQSPRGMEEHVKTQLERLGAKVLGVVLTKVREDLVPSYVYQERLLSEAPRRGLSPVTASLALLVVIAATTVGWLLVQHPQSRDLADLAVGLVRGVVQWTSLRVFGTSL